ncbi:MAG: DnaJ domain-containing protein, partial [Planctomycetes bacterium]|nr:DnaJ domain-containing protein [Planctomycetota bacterium]
MVNYYEVLEVGRKANAEEIRHSFRSLVKKYHPDRNGSNKEWAETKVKLILQAYKTLTNSTQRMFYDRLLQNYLSQEHICFRRNIYKSASGGFDYRYRARAILFDLVNRNVKKALEDYDHLKNDCSESDPLIYMTLNEYIDCKFLLAEEYEKQGEFQKAVEFYEQIYSKKDVTATRRYLFDEIKDRIRNIYCHQLARSSLPQEAINYYKKVLKLTLSRHEMAFTYKKIAECYLTMNDYTTAAKYLNVALALKPQLKGIQRISKKLNQH